MCRPQADFIRLPPSPSLLPLKYYAHITDFTLEGRIAHRKRDTRYQELWEVWGPRISAAVQQAHQFLSRELYKSFGMWASFWKSVKILEKAQVVLKKAWSFGKAQSFLKKRKVIRDNADFYKNNNVVMLCVTLYAISLREMCQFFAILPDFGETGFYFS